MGRELNLEYIFEKTYSQKRVDKDIQESVQFRNREIRGFLDEVKKVTYKDLPTILKRT